jgi:hypothetical protein
VDRAYADGVLEAARRLEFELERVGEDILSELEGDARRSLHSQAIELQQAARELQQATQARSGSSRAALYRNYDELERGLETLAAELRKLPPEQRVLMRASFHLEQAARTLHHALSVGDTSPERTREVGVRQCAAFLGELAELRRAVRYAAPEGKSRRQAEDLLDSLAEDVERLGNLYKEESATVVRKAFLSVSRQWTDLREKLSLLAATGEVRAYLQMREARSQAVFERLASRAGGNR